ncbi:uncharacterized protein PAC_09916 [Phialocephala subalpina]|uniref:Uncharacterized protein n=1 Tax=Phialocephala subalpina TaxID=576137 RepID=A0A1L7X4S5_9HELO|nr:uncharacterized protein PAC_09916 [Phialocephala subalpina]
MEYIFDLEQEVAHLFDLQGLEALSMCWAWPETPIWTKKRRSETITMLILTEMRTPYDYMDGERCQCEELGRALKQVSSTLEFLDISITLYTELDDEIWDVIGTVGSMRDFKILKYIDIPISFLTGSPPHNCLNEIFPEQLETLKAQFWPYPHSLEDSYGALGIYVRDHPRLWGSAWTEGSESPRIRTSR